MITKMLDMTVNSIPNNSKPLYLYKYLLILQSDFTK